ncbi:p505_11L [African swine fever virus]|uniref:p505_11L n=1 Tax=African swine fever virus TaxID=10497 RepID=A0A8A1V5T0_ASF|nr:p505_11L [African swine fever virus]
MLFYQIPTTFYMCVYAMDHILLFILRSKLFGENDGVTEFISLMFGYDFYQRAKTVFTNLAIFFLGCNIQTLVQCPLHVLFRHICRISGLFILTIIFMFRKHHYQGNDGKLPFLVQFTYIFDGHRLDDCVFYYVTNVTFVGCTNVHTVFFFCIQFAKLILACNDGHFYHKMVYCIFTYKCLASRDVVVVVSMYGDTNYCFHSICFYLHYYRNAVNVIIFIITVLHRINDSHLRIKLSYYYIYRFFTGMSFVCGTMCTQYTKIVIYILFYKKEYYFPSVILRSICVVYLPIYVTMCYQLFTKTEVFFLDRCLHHRNIAIFGVYIGYVTCYLYQRILAQFTGCVAKRTIIIRIEYPRCYKPSDTMYVPFLASYRKYGVSYGMSNIVLPIFFQNVWKIVYRRSIQYTLHSGVIFFTFTYVYVEELEYFLRTCYMHIMVLFWCCYMLCENAFYYIFSVMLYRLCYGIFRLDPYDYCFYICVIRLLCQGILYDAPVGKNFVMQIHNSVHFYVGTIPVYSYMLYQIFCYFCGILGSHIYMLQGFFLYGE